MIRRAVLVAALLAPASPGQAQESGVTFNKDVAPILFANCAACHRPGEAGPFSLLTYEDARSRARQIANVTEDRYMPPWPPEAGKGDFVGARRLSDAQIGVLRRWVEAGAPEGAAADLPPTPRFPEGWGLGEPDLVLKTPRPFLVAAAGSDVFWNLVYESPVAATRYVRAVEIRLNDRKVGHHANLLVDRTRSARRLEGKEPGPGFPGMEVSLEAAGFEPDSHFLFWKPGTVPFEEAKGMAWRIDRGTDLVLNMHLRPTGKPEPVTPTIGLYFTDEPPTQKPMLVQLEHDGAIDIPAGSTDFAVTDELTLPVAVDVLAVYPHAHYLGRDVTAWATLPDGTRTWLIHIADWDVNWQAVYRYNKPVSLPKGTKISMRWSYDNSPGNVRNPHTPPLRVRAGNRAEDEMAHLWLQVLPRAAGSAGDPRIPLQQALMRRRLAKYPGDFAAHYNLGAALQAEGRLDDAILELRAALVADPAQATAHNSLGAVLQTKGDLDGAAREYTKALSTRPEDVNAHYNLGEINRMKGRVEAALSHYREAVRLQPDEADLHAQLGATLQQAGSLEEAVREERKALELDPAHANARFNLGEALLQQGQPEAGLTELREARRLRPDDADTRAGLGIALAATGKIDEAIAELQEALRLSPDGAAAHDVLGQLLLARRRAAEAIVHFRAALVSRPKDADLWNNLGSALATTGDLRSAAEAFRRALEIDPQHAAAKANLARAGSALGP
jgi:Flp pilus assembly protein TadD/mono/diheme cytochrome c family protein